MRGKGGGGETSSSFLGSDCEENARTEFTVVVVVVVVVVVEGASATLRL